jgi:hypothetical protein
MGFIFDSMLSDLLSIRGDMLLQIFDNEHFIWRKSNDGKLAACGLTIVTRKACCHAWLRGEAKDQPKPRAKA